MPNPNTFQPKITHPVGMANFLVALTEPEETKIGGPLTRSAIAAPNLRGGTRFLDQLHVQAQANGWNDQIAHIGEPTAFGVIAITCTPAVAETIKLMPGVDMVVPDGDSLQALRA